jgi:enamine deaminase RidA (YjgF/YER057c/UK114 family)
MTAQIKQALDNLEAVLAKGGAKLKDVVRMTYYVKDIPAFRKANPILLKRYTAAGCNPTTSLIGVSALFHPDILFEVEATAVIQ